MLSFSDNSNLLLNLDRKGARILHFNMSLSFSTKLVILYIVTKVDEGMFWLNENITTESACK